MLKAVIIGATGVVGQQFIVALQNHPWFEITGLAASQRSAGKKYSEAIRDPKNGASRWFCKENPLPNINDQDVENSDDLDPSNYDVAFSALESNPAILLESRFAKHIPVVSTSSAYRYESDVPILVPGVNEDHISLLREQRKRGWEGFVSPQPNCTTVGLCMTLKPIQEEFGLESVIMTSLQAVSGAGRSPGVSALDVIDNVVPYIPQEEEKVQKETLKVLGVRSGGVIEPAKIRVSCTCTRVNVTDGHTEAILAITERDSHPDDVKKAMRRFSKTLSGRDLPSAPKELITVNDDPFRPQPKLDRDIDSGMSTTVGRIRGDDSFERGIKYALVSHNTKMGAAKGAVLMSEMLVKAGMI